MATSAWRCPGLRPAALPQPPPPGVSRRTRSPRARRMARIFETIRGLSPWPALSQRHTLTPPAPPARGFQAPALAARQPDGAHLRDHRRRMPLACVLVAQHIDRASAAACDALGRRGAAFAED